MTPKKCPRCQESNQATNRFCARCGIALDSEAKMEIIRQTLERKEADKVLDGLLEDQEFRELFLRKIVQMGGKPTQSLSEGPKTSTSPFSLTK